MARSIYKFDQHELKFPRDRRRTKPPEIWYLTPEQLERVRKGERTTDVLKEVNRQ